MLDFQTIQTEPEDPGSGWSNPALAALPCTEWQPDALNDANVFLDYKFLHTTHYTTPWKCYQISISCENISQIINLENV